MSRTKLRITHTLLSSWIYGLASDEGYEDFLKALRRERSPQTQAMLDGIMFENMVYTYADGTPIPNEAEWRSGVIAIGDRLRGATFQVALDKDIEIDGVMFHLYGILDALRRGSIYDVKLSKRYEYGKYKSSTQHPMYFALCPEARNFTYEICDGKYVFEETYYPDQTPPIEQTIKNFMKYLDTQNLVELYAKNFSMQY